MAARMPAAPAAPAAAVTWQPTDVELLAQAPPSHVDLEALEAENDRGIAALGDRVGALRGLTGGIHGEVESQHRLLDSMVRWGAGGGAGQCCRRGLMACVALPPASACTARAPRLKPASRCGGSAGEASATAVAGAARRCCLGRPCDPTCRRSLLRRCLQAMSMGGVQLSLRATADKMGRVLSEPSRRRQVYWAGCAAVLLFFLYLWLRR